MDANAITMPLVFLATALYLTILVAVLARSQADRLGQKPRRRPI